MTSTDPTHMAAGRIATRNLRVLSLSTVYPRPSEPALGIFVARRLEALAKLTDLRVIAPVALLEYGNANRKLWERDATPRSITLGGVPVDYPRWFYPPRGGVMNAGFLAARVLPMVRALRPFDLIDAHFGYPDGIAAAAIAQALDCPFMITLRGNETMHAQNPLRRRALVYALRRAARVVTVSERLREFAIAMGAAPSRVRTIPNGVDADIFFPRDPIPVRRQYDLAPTQRMILSAGALIERKGHHRAITALEEILRAGVDAKLVIAGGPGREGAFENTLREMVAAKQLESRVIFTGPLPAEQLAELMSAADVFCLASTREGWPNVVHEALACGSPVVAADVGGVPDMVSAESGIVVPSGDQGSLDRALLEALSRSWNRTSISDRARMRSWNGVALEVLAEMHQACPHVGGSN